jgi:hypothetical protein
VVYRYLPREVGEMFFYYLWLVQMAALHEGVFFDEDDDDDEYAHAFM